MNQSHKGAATREGVKYDGFIDYDFSDGATKTYRVEARHRMIPNCMVCGQGSRVLLKGDDYYKYFVQGAPISIFDYLTMGEREILITGTHPQCWEAMTGGDEK